MNKFNFTLAGFGGISLVAAAVIAVSTTDLRWIALGCALFALVLIALGIAYRLEKLTRTVKQHAEPLRKIRDIANTTGRSAGVIRTIDGKLDAVEKSLANSGRVLSDTAGSTGKSAPRIRNIERSVAALVARAGGTAASAPVSVGSDGTAKGSHSVTATDSPSVLGSAAKSDAEDVDLRPAVSVATNLPTRTLKVAVVLDEFSRSAWSHEWLQYEMTPSGWSDALDTVNFDMLFVESAWNGNGGSWLYQLVGPRSPSPELTAMVAAFRRKGIPTVFWNKEDPPHFDDFVKTASLFDWVLTSDQMKVDDYKRILGHQRISVMSFAAQPALHNPIQHHGKSRDRPVAFGGMYFRHKYPERRAQMDFLLGGVADLGLDIYSRHADGNPDYAFPERLASQVRGALEYPVMVDAYKRYKVMLNVNSVTSSPSMCARRIFEVAACGGAIVTPPSAAIPNFFAPDEITVARDAQEAHALTRALIRSDEHRDRVAHRARRRVWSEHTYGHRLDELSKLLDIAAPRRTRRPRVSVLCSTIRPHLLPNLFRTVASQTESDLQLVLNLHGISVPDEDLASLREQHGVDDVVVLRTEREQTLGECLNEMVLAADGELVAKIDDDDYYGPHYLQDLIDSYLVSGAEVVGKAASYVHFAGNEQTILTYRGHEQRFSEFVRGATLMLSRSTAGDLKFGDGNRSEDSVLLQRVKDSGGTIFASDRFNYCVYRATDTSQHTWQIDDASLFATGDVVGFGDFVAMITV